jgi:hypothetical protein
VRGAETTARRAGELKQLVSSVNPQVAEVRDPREGLSRDEDAVASLERVAEQNQGPYKAQPPEGLRNNDTSLALGGIPLDDKTAEKDGVTHPSHHLPDMPLNPQKTSLDPHQS